MDCFEGYEDYFEHDSFSDRKPMKLAKDWLHVAVSFDPRHKPGSCILNALQLIQLTGWQTKKQRIAVVKPRCNKGVHQRFSGCPIEISSQPTNFVQGIRCAFAYAANMLGHRHTIIKDNTEILGGWCKVNFESPI